MMTMKQVMMRACAVAIVAATAMGVSTPVFAEDAGKIAVGDTSQLLFSYGISGINTPTTASITPVPTGQWVTALAANFDASKATKDGLIAQTSAITAILTGDYHLGTGSFMLNFAGVQARVLINCVLPACDPSSDTVPAANLADPGVIFLDQAAHLAFDLSDADTMRIAVDLAAGARSFNFYKAKIGSAHKKSNSVLYQVRFNAGGFSAGDAVSGAIVAVAKRTMILETVDLDSRR